MSFGKKTKKIFLIYKDRMAISKEKKWVLIKEYVDAISHANGVVVVQQSGVSVNDITEMRRSLLSSGAKFVVVRKRLFLRAVKEAGLQDIDINTLDGSIAVLFGGDDDMAPLKIVNTIAKRLKKEKVWLLKFLWAWYDKDWKDGDYVTELANVPSQEESLSKLVYLLNYPVQHFAATLKALAEKVWDGDVVVQKEQKVQAEEVKWEEEVKNVE